MTMKIDPLTEEEQQEWPKDPLVGLEKPFVDDRGAIQPLVDMMMKSAVLISSVKGSFRANHYHRTDWHYCYVLEGSIEYYHRPTGSDTEPEVLLVKEGQMVFTPPMVDHGMKFPEDTKFLTLSRNPRDQASYEADVVRINMIDTEGLTTWTPED
ncbi:MAG: cupin domain-containing protein [Rhodospirillales bacterium]|jgi:dTDP-4-dehydrorhamnose 3,5-epimerase-like enzyme|nr:cupin domain-containing protein [Rhodospirillales bacterium]